MSVTVVLNGVSYSIPEPGDNGWGQGLTDYMTAQASGLLQKAGGSFTLTAEVDFGATYGVKSSYFKSRSSNVSTAGVGRLAVGDSIGWRNTANSGNLLLAVNGSDQLTFNGTVIQTAGNYITALTGNVVASGPGSAVATIQAGVIVNSMVSASAAIAFSKISGTVPINQGGTGQITANAGLNALLPSQSGSANLFLKSNGTDSSWASPAGSPLAITAKTANYTLTSSDDFVAVNGSGGSFTLNLPAAASNTGKLFRIKRNDMTLANVVTIDGNASETIDGALTVPLNTQYEEYTIVSDGSNWEILDHFNATPFTSYTPTFVGNGSKTMTLNQSAWRRVGDSMEVIIQYSGNSVASGAAATTITISLPSGTAIDTAKTALGDFSVLGVGNMFSVITSSQYDATTLIVSASSTTLEIIKPGTNGFYTQNDFNIARGVQLAFQATFPISGWRQ